MKRVLTIFFSLISVICFGQAHYNPAQQPGFTFVVNKPFGEAFPVALDARSEKADTINGLYRPYNGTAEVLTYLNTTQSRTGWFPIVVNVGGSLQSNGSFVGGTIFPYWFLRGFADSQLVLMNTPGLTSFNGRTATNVIPTTGDYTFSQIGSTPTTIAGYGITDAVSINGVQTLTNKSMSGATNTFSNIPNSALTNNSIGLTIGTTGSDINVSVSPAPLGTSIGLNIPTAGTGTRGALSAANWNYFNAKVDSIHVSNDSLFDFTGGVGTFRGAFPGASSVISVSNSDGSLTISPITGIVVASLNVAHSNTWPATQTFDGVIMAGQISFSANNTWAIGSGSQAAAHVWSRIFNSDASATLSSASGNFVALSVGASLGVTLLSTGQVQFNNYTTSSSFTGTPLAFLQTDASGNIVQTPIGNIQVLLGNEGVGYRLFDPVTNKMKTVTCTGCTLDSLTSGQINITVSGGGSGTVTTVSVVTANGFAGTVANASTTPAITLTTSVNGLVFGNGTSLAAATISSPLTYSAGTLAIQVANTSQNGYLSSTDWNTFNGKLGTALTSANIFVGNASNVATAVSPSGDWTINNTGVNVIGNNKITLAKLATNTANTLIGFDGSGNPVDVTAGTNITISAGAISASGAGLSGNGFVFQTGGTTSYVSGSATNLMGYNASGTSSAIVLGTNLSMSGGTLNATGGVPSLTASHIFLGGASNTAVDTPFVNDLGQMQEIDQLNAGLGLNSTIDSIAGYHYDRVDSVPYYYTTSGVGGENGGWLTNSSTGDSIEIGPPICVIIGNSIAAGHPALKGRLETGGGTGGFISNYPDSTGQLSYEFRAKTNMRWYNMGIGGQTTVQIRNRFLRDAIGLTINVGDGRPNQTLPRRPSFIIIEGAVNDFFATSPVIPLSTTKANILWMADICKQYHIPCALMNSTGDAIANQQQLASIRSFNDWLKTGILYSYDCYVIDVNSFWNDPTYGNDNIHHISDIADDIHFTKTGYQNLATYIFNKAHLPVMDSIRFITAIAPTNPIANYFRPTSVSVGRGTAYGATYTLANSPTVTVPITQPIMDSTWFGILASTNVTGSTPISGFSSILFHVGNNPTHQVWYTKRANFAGGFTGVINNTNLNIQGRDGNGDTTIDVRLPDGVGRAFQVVVGAGGASAYFNQGATSVKYNNAVFNVTNPSTTGTGIGTNAGIYSAGSLNSIGGLQINFNSSASSTGRGISTGNSGQSEMRFEVNPTNNIDDYWFTYFTGTSKNVTAAASGSISHYNFPMGWNSFTTINQTANDFWIHPTLNNTGSFSGSLYVGIHYAATVTALNGASHYGLWVENGLSVFGTAAGDAVLIGTTTNVASSILTVASTTQGFLPPRMTTTQINAISSPAEGLVAYDNVLHAPYYFNGTAWTAFGGGGGSQTWQQTLTTGSTLNTTNTVTNTGQSFTWNNGGTGTFKFSGILTDTTNAAYVLFKKKDSSVAEMTFANLATYLPADTFNLTNGLTLTTTSSTNHTGAWGGTLTGATSIAQAGFSVTFSGGQFIHGNTGGTVNWNPGAAILGSIISIQTGTLNDNVTATSGTVTNAIVTGMSTPILTATNTGVTVTNAFNLFVNGPPVASTNVTITNAYSFGVNGAALFQSQLNTGSIAFKGYQTVTSGSSATINNVQTNFLVNPSTLIASFTITLPSAPDDGQLVKIHFGGTITSGATVVTTLTISPNSGQTIEQTVAPVTALGGDCFMYQFNEANSVWYREK